MAKYPRITQNEETGWSDWLKPVMKGYKMACCDCGLVHEMDFSVVKQKEIVKKYKDGNHSYAYEEIENPKYQVSFRAKRSSRATAQHRRFKQYQKFE